MSALGLWVFAAPAQALIFPPGLGFILAFEDSYVVLENRQKFINLRAYHQVTDTNITDPDDLVYSIVTGPSHGTLTAVPNSMESYQYVYIPDADYGGTDSFIFKVKKTPTSFQSDTGVISIDVKSSYTAPYGIAAPDFGIAESHTMYADTATYQYDYGNGDQDYRVHSTFGPYTHWVDLADGDDTNNPFGTTLSPRKTIPTTDLPAGSVVVITSGADDDTFTSAPRVFTVAGGGSLSLPVFIRGRSAANKATLKRSMKIEANYVIVENIDFDAGDADALPTGNFWFGVEEQNNLPDPWGFFHHVAIRHCALRDLPTSLSSSVLSILFNISQSGPNIDDAFIMKCVVYDVEVWAFGDWESLSTIDHGTVVFAVNSLHGWVLDSNIHHVQGSGTGATRNNALSNQTPAQNIYFGRNFLHHNQEKGVEVKHGVNIIVSQNKIYRYRNTASNAGGGIGFSNADATATWPFSDNVWVLFNEIYDSHLGIRASLGAVTDPDNDNARLYVIGNVIHHILPFGTTPPVNFGNGISQFKLAQAWYVNNTLSKCRRAFIIGFVTAEELLTSSAEFINNSTSYTIQGVFPDLASHVSVNSGDMLIKDFAFDYNHHFDSIRFLLPSGAGTNDIRSLQELRDETIFGDSSIDDADPFVARTTFDFRLASPAGDNLKDSGTSHSVYTDFDTAFGTGFPSIKHDFRGKGIGDPDWPIGAFSD